MKVISFVLCFLAAASSAVGYDVAIKGNVYDADKTSRISGATLTCYDYDSVGRNDYLTSGYSKYDGNFDLKFTAKSVSSWCSGWDCADLISLRNPDVYCKVTKYGYLPYHTKMVENHDQSRDVNFYGVPLFPDRSNQCRPDGCTWVPDYVFTGQCNNHDCCYATCGKSKQSCDNEFYHIMFSRCRDVFGQEYSSLSGCYAIANLYYTGVTTAPITSGKALDAYRNAQRMSRCRRLGSDDGTEEDDIKNITVLPERFPEDDGYFFVSNPSVLNEKTDVATWVLVPVAAAILITMLLLLAIAFKAYRLYVKHISGSRTEKEVTSLATESTEVSNDVSSSVEGI